MKAALVEAPGKLAVRDIPQPQPGDYEALCQLLYGGICTGTDTHIVDGTFPWIDKLPTVLGHESIGRVVQVGAKVRNFKIGDLLTRVGTKAAPDGAFTITWGGFAEYGLAVDHQAMQAAGVPREQWAWHTPTQVLPPGTPPDAAVMVITWRETLSYVTRMGFKPGKSVLIIGSGGNGLSFVAHAKHIGLTRIACIGAPERDAATRQTGATEFHSYRAAGQIAPGFDFIIDAVGKERSLDAVLPLIAPGGTAGIYGLDDFGKATINPTRAGTFTFYNGHYDEAEAHDRVVKLMQEGKLDARLWFDLDHPYPLDRINDAFTALRQRRHIKALVKLTA